MSSPRAKKRHGEVGGAGQAGPNVLFMVGFRRCRAAMPSLEKSALEVRRSETMIRKIQDRFREQSDDDRNHADAIRRMPFDRYEDPFETRA